MSTIVKIGYDGFQFEAYVVSGKVVGAYQNGLRVSDTAYLNKLQEVYDAG